MNILIADCGATTCNYHVILGQDRTENDTITGFSPIADEWKKFPIFPISYTIDKVYFYGTAMTGVFSGQAQKALRHQFPLARITVLSDLHAAGFSAAGDGAAYIHIIGTGSSTCYIEAGNITFPLINMGYLWEDYASGYDIAKTLIAYWANNQLSDKDSNTLKAHLGEPIEFIKRTYKNRSPKGFLAQYSHLINKMQHETQIKIKNERLDHFFRKNIDNFADSKPHHFIGSMAVMMEKEIRKKMQDRNLLTGNFLQSTGENLVEYHRNKMTNHNE